MPRVRSHLVLVALLSLCVARANAQGTQGQLPDPISAARLVAYADALGLSAQQLHALQELHAPYRAEFESLREKEITDWLNATRSGLIARSHYLKRRDLLERIAGIDARFFDSVLPILTEEQTARLVRVRGARQRERAIQVSGVWVWNDAPPVDLSQVIEQAGLTSDERKAIDATLASHESALTMKFQDAVDDYFATFQKSFDAYERAGWTEERRADPANDEAAYAVARPIWLEWARQRHVKMNAIVDLNQRTLSAIRPLLSPAHARDLWVSFVTATYANTHFLYHLPLITKTTSPYAKALARENLTAEHRAILQAQSDTFNRDIDAMIAALIEKVQAYRDTYVGADEREDEFAARNALDRAAREAWEALGKRRGTDRDRIAALIGPEPVLVAEDPDPATADFAKISHDTVIFGRPEISVWLPPAVSTVDIADFVQWLALDESQSERLRAAHERYLQLFVEFKAKYQPIMREMTGVLYAGDTIQGWTTENLRRRRDAEAAAMAAQRAIEAAFFSEIALISGRDAVDAELQRVRLARERQWSNNRSITGSSTRQAGCRCDGMFDLERVLRRVHGLDLSAPAVDAILAEYEKAVAPLFRMRQAAMLAYSRVDDDLRVEWQGARVRTGNDYPDMKPRHAEMNLKGLQEAVRTAADPIAALNRETVERLEGSLPVEQAQRVRLVYEKLTWPHIYQDRFSTAPLLAAALNLRDVTPQQRREIENAAAEYHPAYNAICERMKTMVEGPGSAIYDQASASQEELLAFRRRWEERDRVVFERYELNTKVWQRLKGTLTEDQSKAIGMSAVPPDPPTNDDQFGT